MLNKGDKLRGDAMRLAVVLEQYAADPATIKRLAPLLHYYEPQLEKDLKALYRYIKELEEHYPFDEEED